MLHSFSWSDLMDPHEKENMASVATMTTVIQFDQ